MMRKALGIALEEFEIGALGGSKARLPRLRGQSGGVEPMANRVFAGMAERGIAEIMRERGGRNDGPDVGSVDLTVRKVPLANLRAHPRAERPADAGDFQPVGEAGANVVVVGQRKDLGLVLQATEGRGEDDAIRVDLKWGTRGVRKAGRGQAETVGAQELAPIHGREVVGLG